jgi:glycosyltransferase involved in cell wall biosynthesis
MKILVVSQYFWPEEFRINDLAIELSERGHEVFVLTGNPNYPKGKFNQGYGFKFAVENYRGIKIYRVPIIARGNASGFRLAMNYLSFALTASCFALFHRDQYDIIFAVNYSPITAVFPAIVYKKRFNTPLFLWVQDLWPESISAAGKIKLNFLMPFLNKMVQYIYKNSNKILVQSEAFIPHVEEKGVNKEKISYLPNWAEDLYSNMDVPDLKYQNILSEGFIVMFAGNIGDAQDFESIIRAVEITRRFPEIKWVIVGEGRKKSWIKSEIVRLDLENTVFLLGRYPVEEMPSFFVHADILFLSLKDEGIFSMTIPGKLQSYLAFGKPIVGMLSGIGADVIRKANCGYVGNAGDYRMLANNIIEAYQQDSDILIKKGINGKNYYKQNFSKIVIIDNLVRMFEDSNILI